MHTQQTRACRLRIKKAHTIWQDGKDVKVPDQVEDGLFHMWFTHYYTSPETGNQGSELYAVVERASGKVVYADAEDIKFTDHDAEPWATVKAQGEPMSTSD